MRNRNDGRMREGEISGKIKWKREGKMKMWKSKKVRGEGEGELERA